MIANKAEYQAAQAEVEQLLVAHEAKFTGDFFADLCIPHSDELKAAIEKVNAIRRAYYAEENGDS